MESEPSPGWLPSSQNVGKIHEVVEVFMPRKMGYKKVVFILLYIQFLKHSKSLGVKMSTNYFSISADSGFFLHVLFWRQIFFSTPTQTICVPGKFSEM